MTMAMRAMRSAACCLILAALLLRRHLMVPQIWGRYGLARIFRLFTTVPKPFSITLASSDTCQARHTCQLKQASAQLTGRIAMKAHQEQQTAASRAGCKRQQRTRQAGRQDLHLLLEGVQDAVDEELL